MVLALISLSIAHPYAHATSGPINNRSVNSITWLPLIDQSSYLERLKESICQHCHLTLSHKQMHQTRRNKNQNVCCSFRNAAAAAAAAKSLPSCLTLCDPIDGSPPGSEMLLAQNCCHTPCLQKYLLFVIFALCLDTFISDESVILRSKSHINHTRT